MALWLALSILLTQNPLARTESGSVSGVVRLPDGTPASGVRVAALVPPDASFRPGTTSELASIGKTDESGHYRLEDVPAGRYYIVAGRVDAPTYYPGVPSVAGATVLSVTAGAALTEINFVISAESTRAPDRTSPFQQLWTFNLLQAGPPLQAPARIVMDATSEDKKLPAWITVNARNEVNLNGSIGGMQVVTSGSSAIRSTVASDGSFSISLKPGEATISVQGLPEGYSVKSITSGSTNLLTRPVTVQAGMAEIVVVLTADLRRRFTVEGRVLSGTENRSMIGEQIELVSDSGATVRIILDAQGQFVFRKLLPGNYILRLASSDLKISEQRITVTDRDVTAIELNSSARPPQ